MRPFIVQMEPRVHDKRPTPDVSFLSGMLVNPVEATDVQLACQDAFAAALSGTAHSHVPERGERR